MASPSTSTSFPAVGDTFTSLKAFKQAAYSAAITQSLHLRVFSSHKGTSTDINCIGGGSQWATVYSGEAECTCRINAYIDRDTGVFRVTKSVELHSCTPPDPHSEEGKAARVDMACRLRALGDADDSNTGDEKSTDSSLSDESSSNMDLTSEEEEAESAGFVGKFGRRSVQPDRLGGKKKLSTKRQRVEQPDAEEVDRDRQALPKRGRRSRLTAIPKLAKRDLRSDVVALAKGPALDLPSATESFSNLRRLAVHIHAWAEQNDLKLYHGPAVDRLTFVCIPDAKKPRCPFEIVLFLFPFFARHGLAYAFDLLRPPVQASLPLHCTVDFRTARCAVVLPHAHPPHRLPHLPFLLHPFDILNLQTFLLHSGVSTVADLVALAEFEERTLVELVETVKARKGWTDEQAYRVVEGLEVYRAALERA
ncbi:hypothetical protein JCM8097_003788 [Rhodosporidiobolus ruineniae]